ncbi:hypothetical protein [Marivita sp.]|uniref:hypothetical protein n=1 Tax=Marivita sp. TaxID=2003365 RepID=UPI003F6FADDB
MELLMTIVTAIGTPVKDVVLFVASLVANEAMPGFVVVLLVGCLAAVTLALSRRFGANRAAVRSLRLRIEETGDAPFYEAREVVSAWIVQTPHNIEVRALAEAWSEFNETVIIDESRGEKIAMNAIRPSAFFNIEDLHYGPGFFRIVPGLFVSAGLALTFLGLIAALAEMSQGGRIDDQTMSTLIGIASAKFIMSLVGLVCSIVFTILLRRMSGQIDRELNLLCRALEQRLIFVSLEEIGLRQLQSMIEDREHHRRLTAELVAEIGGPLKTELPQAISTAISTAMQPLIETVSRQGAESVSSMAADLSQQLSSGVGAALTAASERLAFAGEKIGQIADRLDQSSGRMGSEMETAVVRVAQAVDDLRSAMAATAQETTGSFSAGAEKLLAVMNDTLAGIRDNTSAGAKAMLTAAEEMRASAQNMRTEMEAAAQSGAEAAKLRMEAAGAQAGDAIDGAGRVVLDAFGKAGADIAAMSQSLSENAGRELIQPVAMIADQIEDIVASLTEAAAEMRGYVGSVKEGAKAGADAAVSFRGASKDLVAATGPVQAATERIESAMRLLSEGTQGAVTTVTRSAQATAESAARTLATAEVTLSAERRGIEQSLAGTAAMVERLKGQGDRMDVIDEKLGRAFEVYATSTEQAMQAMRTHVSEMSQQLSAALSTLQNIVDQFQEFQPQQARR